MESGIAQSPGRRPQHRRNPSSKSNILKALVSPRSGGQEQAGNGASPSKSNERIQSVPLLPPDHPHVTAKGRPLGERHSNMQSPPSSPSKSRQKSVAVSKTSYDLRPSDKKATTQEASSAPKKTKSSTNLSAVFAKMNRSNKDLSDNRVPKDKENTTPPSSSNGPPAETPIWAQYNTSAKQRDSRPTSRDDNKPSDFTKDEIAKYTPQEYSPSKQRNFNQPQLRPTLGGRSRPQSAFVLGTDIVGAVGRRVSGDRSGVLPGRKSLDLEDRHKGKDDGRHISRDEVVLDARTGTGRKTSGSSAEQAPAKEKLNITKRGSRVMAAVAAFNGKSKDQQPSTEKEEAALDPKAVDQAFEAVLDSRNVPEQMRHKMRSLTLRVKADFIKQDQEASLKTPSGSSPPGTAGSDAAKPASPTKAQGSSPGEQNNVEDDSKSTKRSRPRSRTFTFSKGDKKADPASPSKKQRARSKSRSRDEAPATPTTPRTSMDGRKKNAVPTAVPADFITYLRQNQDPVKLEVGRIHKLRILLRNETVAWVDSFISLGGMSEIVGLLHRILAVEWREEHEDQLLHETLLCLKGLCTTERAMVELEKVADDVFPELIGMLFDEEKKGPAEYTTRGIVISVLFNFLASATTSSAKTLEQRARKILTYVGEPTKAEDARPVDFVLDMRVPRPYKLWCREVSNVTKEVFWIFLHHLNVVPLPKPGSSGSDTSATSTVSTSDDERKQVLEQTFTQRHFPGTRPPVPAAPYIGGVEWDATTYITSHLDLLNGLIASLPTAASRNQLRSEMQESGFEKVLGSTLRTCKEKFYGGVHDGLRAWVAAALEDGWGTRFVREGPTREEEGEWAMKKASPKKSPAKKEKVPVLEAPKLDLGFGDQKGGKGKDYDDDGWLG